MMRHSFKAALLAATSVSGTGMAAQPQETTASVPPDAPAAASASASSAAGDIIVTAQRRGERLVDVPISVTTLDATELAKSGIQSTRDLEVVTPGLVMSSVGVFAQPAIRAISSSGTNAGEEANVATYVDDVYIPAQFGGIFKLADIERVEVLKGPQGTLFGRNSTGGAIRISTRKPSFDPTASLSASYGFKLNEVQLNGYASTGLSKTIAASIAGYYNDDDGYLLNVNPAARGRTGNTNGYVVRGKLLFEPSSDFSVMLQGDHSRNRDVNIQATAPIANQSSLRGIPGYITPDRRNYETAFSFNPVVKTKGSGVSLTAQGALGDVTIKSITAYRRAAVDQVTDTDRSSLDISSVLFNITTKSFSQELLVFADLAQGLSSTAGLFYYDADSSFDFNSFAGNPSATSRAAAFRSGLGNKSYAAFADLTYKISDKFVLIGGARYTSEKKQYTYRDIQRPPTLALRTTEASDKWSNPTFRAVAQYFVTPSANIYASFSTGFKSGVFNTFSAVANSADPEKIAAYEIGAKAELGSGFLFEAAAFHYDYKDLQLQSYDVTFAPPLLLLQNAATAKIDGLEASITARSRGGLSGQLGVAWLPTAKYDSFNNAQVFVPLANGGNQVAQRDISGSRMIRAPKLSLTARIGYETPLFGGTLGLNGNFAYKTSYLHAPGEIDPLARQKGYEIVNGQVSWSPPGDSLTFSVYGENLTNSQYFPSIAEGGSSTVGGYSRPRQFGLRVDAKF